MKNLLALILMVASTLTYAQKTTLDSLNVNGIKLRSIGPAFMTGRIADIAIDPEDENHWYVAVGSGGVWETKNGGITFKPIFDGQKVYSIGCVTIDPTNNNRIWVGTGENVGGRHISFGDGIYKSEDGGATWKNMGLKTSEHISKIIVHPENSDVIWVASQGPLWNGGGERGLYKSTDGGESWKRVLGDEEWTGVTDVLIDLRNPEVLYAATWQRHRTVANYLGGGPKSGVHKSTDGGETWTKLTNGLPSGNMGKIGLGISPIDPDIVYAAIELDLRKGAVYRSSNRGGKWVKMSNTVSGGTGPHYYQELWVSPHQLDHIYLANNYLLFSNDGGRTFNRVKNKYKHVDNHALVFKHDDPDYLLVGTDGGLYESLDQAENWRHIGNLPITQYYKLAVDDAKPFYNIYGGTQDNNTQGGPSRTDRAGGIVSSDWKVVLGGDGHQPATEPGNPNILYAQSQQGYYSRVDMITGERVGIQPQPGEGEPFERFNWDAPILVSSHNPAHIYVASQRLWKSTDRGDSWTVLSGDLTRDEERFDLPIMGRKQSFDNPWDVYAMSTYNTITSIAESPKNSKLIYVGTDDGFIQVTEDEGETWRKIDVKSLPGVPKRAYINDIKADKFDENTVYVAIDAHKQGDYKPYLFVSKNKGKTWKSIASNLPDRDYVWRIVQDHKKPELLFVGTEFGLYFSIDGGDYWKKFNGLPTISFRDLAIQEREEDLVAASFGRGFYVLDDYSFLRELNDEVLENEASLFKARDAWQYIPKRDGKGTNGSLGGQDFVAENPEFGVVLTYYINEDYPSAKKERTKEEKKKNEKEVDVDFPGWDTLAAEYNESTVQYYMEIYNDEGKVINRMKVPSSKGIHRVNWNLRNSMDLPISKGAKLPQEARGFRVSEGTYNARLVKVFEGVATRMGDKIEFGVKDLYQGALPEASEAEKTAYYDAYMVANKRRTLLTDKLNDLTKVTQSLEVATLKLDTDYGSMLQDIAKIKKSLYDLDIELKGNPAKNAVGEKTKPTLNSRLSAAGAPLWGSNYGPTETAKQNLKIAENMLAQYETDLAALDVEVAAIESRVKELGGVLIRGRD
jgi:photosystem II stability/assembly factor-like uncharacterized protein